MPDPRDETVEQAIARRPVLTAPQQVAMAIEDLVLEGALRPGDRLPNVDVAAERFGVSLPTAQRGLHALRDAGVLTVARGRNGGYRVAPAAVEAIGRIRGGALLGRPADSVDVDYEQLLEVRRVQDVLAARVAAVRRTDADLALLEAVLPGAETVGDDLDAAFDLDLVFHRALALCTHNPLIVRFTTTTTLALRRFSRTSDRIGAQDVVFALDRVVAAVRRCDEDGAAEAMRMHLHRSADFFVG